MKFIIALLVLVALSLGAWSLLKGDAETEEDTENVTSELEPYISEPFGFSFSYPNDLVHTEFSRTHIGIGRPEGDTVRHQAAVLFRPGSKETPDEITQEYIFESIKLSCLEYQEPDHRTCITAVDVENFISANGTEGIQFYLTYEARNTDTKELVREGKKGPYIAFVVESVDGQKDSILYIMPPMDDKDQEPNVELIRTIASSIELPETTALPVLGFIRSVRASSIEFDEATWLTGKAAEDAAIHAGQCTEATRAECLTNGYFIENADKTARSIQVSPAAIIKMETYATGEPGDEAGEALTVPQLAQAINGNKERWSHTPFHVTLENDIVVHIEEQYIP